MKYLKSVLIHTPDQVISTLLLWFCMFLWYRAFKSIIDDPPSCGTILTVILIGIGLGLITARTQMKVPNEKDTKISTVDR